MKGNPVSKNSMVFNKVKKKNKHNLNKNSKNY